MKKVFTLLLLALTSNLSFAQDQVFFKNTTFENADFSVVIDNASSTYGEAKFKIQITNKTSDFLILKPAECVFKINGKNFSSIDNDLFIPPNSTDSRNMSLPGTNFNKVQNYSFVLSGLYKISTSGTKFKAADFKLPASEVLVFKAGDFFNCTMDTLIKTTDKTSVTFSCLYEGDKIGLIDPSKTYLKVPNGNEYPNQKINAANPATKSKSDILMLTKGQTIKTTLEWTKMPGGKGNDMAKLDLVVLFKETFGETTRQRLGGLVLELKYDEVKNKQ